MKKFQDIFYIQLIFLSNLKIVIFPLQLAATLLTCVDSCKQLLELV